MAARAPRSGPSARDGRRRARAARAPHGRGRRARPGRAARVATLIGALLWLGASTAAATAGDLPPSPYDILRSRHLRTPLLDAVPRCLPGALDPALDPVIEHIDASEWREARALLSKWARSLDRATPELVLIDGVLQARGAVERADRVEAEERLAALLRREDVREVGFCARMERARLLLLMSREAEAAAQLTRAERWLEARDAQDRARSEAIAFWRAEILYRTDRAFDAHLAYRKLSRSEDPRLALAARLRLTDLSFDAGKVERVSEEYEALLPRASAFGASTVGWALRAAEAALDAGEHARAQRWLERFLESGPERDVRDAAEIRLADLDVLYEDVMAARKRLTAISGRRRSDPTGALAGVRAIDLGVAPGSADQRLDLLLRAVRDQREGVRRYALGVLMDELADRGDLDGALAVATRLAYEGVDPVVSPDYITRLDGLLAAVARRDPSSQTEAERCRELVRALGGRYGILIERATRPEAFVAVGECFEDMELPWLAATLYRSITRRFGTVGAEQIALPLARVSLAVDEVPLARRVASAALEEPDENAPAWRAILAEANFLEGRRREAAEGLRSVLSLDEEAWPALARDRGRLVRMLALTLPSDGSATTADFIAQRVPGWIARGDPEPAARAAMVEAAMLAAHAHRKAGRARRASALYQVVEAAAGPGALRSSARFWLGFAGEPRLDGADAWGEDPDVELGTPWARYARFERNVGPLWTAYGSLAR